MTDCPCALPGPGDDPDAYARFRRADGCASMQSATPRDAGVCLCPCHQRRTPTPHEHIGEYEPTHINNGVHLAVTGKGESFAVLVKLGSMPWVSLSSMVAAELAEKLEAFLYADT